MHMFITSTISIDKTLGLGTFSIPCRDLYNRCQSGNLDPRKNSEQIYDRMGADMHAIASRAGGKQRNNVRDAEINDYIKQLGVYESGNLNRARRQSMQEKV